jgi:hypothetical protein
MTYANLADYGRDLATIVEAAAEIILPFWRTELDVVRKADESPVTEADKAGERLILARLAERFPKSRRFPRSMPASSARPTPSARASSWSTRSTAPRPSCAAIPTSRSISA